MTHETSYMRRALQLARLGIGSARPNPLVGCVLVQNDRIIGEGYHQTYGEAHAEVHAVRAVANPADLEGATAYVTLEPCAHVGKTPPCADLLVEKKVGRVVVATTDPNPLVAGKGLAILQAAGITTEVGLLEAEARHQNRRFFTFLTEKRPYIVLKWAETADGFLARSNFDARWISNPLSRKLVHKWRSEEAAILVGANTALHDDPQLNVRDWQGKDPLRIVAEGTRTLPTTLQLFQGKTPALRYRVAQDNIKNQTEKSNEVYLPENVYLSALFADLYQRKVQSVLVEGGSRILHELLAADLWDEIRLFRSRQSFGSGIRAPHPQGHCTLHTHVLDDTLLYFHRQRASSALVLS